jgi:hypothetical protein
LVFQYQMDYLNNSIEEECSCNFCQVIVRKDSHPLQ